MNRIKYITKYDTDDSNEGRIYNLSTKNLDDYILSVLRKQGFGVDVFSPTITGNNTGYYKKRVKNIDNSTRLVLFRTFGGKTKLIKSLSKMFSVIDLFIFLIFKTKRNEPIIVRHSLIFAFPVFFAKKAKGFKLILNFGEEYNKVQKGNILYQWIEPKLIKSADKYIFANDLMGELYNVDKSKYIVVYGQYQNNSTKEKQIVSDNKIHLVYAGIISRKEKSAFRAIELADYLDNRYVIHILGNPDSSITTNFDETIKSANENCKTGCKIKYDGVKTGEDYIMHLSKFDIGLNLRSTDEEYIDFAFPSKILSYLNIGLRVVSSRIKCVEKSKIGDLLFYFNGDNTEIIAAIIKNINLKEQYNPHVRLLELDHELKYEINRLLER